MATAITMPRLGLTMVEGTVVEWRAAVGDVVAAADVLLVIESEKTSFEVEAFSAGVLAAIYAEPGTTLPTGALLGALAGPGEAFDAAAFAACFVPAAGAARAASQPAPTTCAPAAALRDATAHEDAARPRPGVVKAAPAARALARRLAIDLASVRGSGPGGRITPEDVDRAARTRVRVDGGTLTYATAGEGPPVLLIAGLGVDTRAWRRQVDDLREAATVIAYDQRGVGGSSPAAATTTIAQLADDAAAVLAHAATGPAVVVGASLGAAVALEVALRHPQTTRALVLLTPAFERDARLEAVLRSWAAPDADPEARVRAMLPWLLGRAWLAHAGKREAFASTLRAMTPQIPSATLRAHVEALLPWLGTRTGALAALDVPVLVVAGTDDVLTTPAHAQALARALPNGRLELLVDAGHALMIEQPDTVNRLIRDLVVETRSTERAPQ